ncbi:MAG: hypothetical protein JW757_04945 [Anaerolineales bacterium]|nr:hypothetical protein [Anaerolineales bacterium]
MISQNNKYRLHAIKTIMERVSQTRFWGLGIFVTLAVSLAFSSVLLVNFSRFTETNLITVEKQPLTAPILLSVILISLYLSLTISLNVSREYSNNTIEMLFYGPVDESAYMLGNFFAQLKVFLYSLIGILVWLNLSIWLLNLDFRLDIFLMLGVSILMCGQWVAFGLLVASWGGKRRNTLVYFMLTILLIGGIQAGDFIAATLVQIQSPTATDPLVVARNVLSGINGLISWISPYSQLSSAFEAILENSTSGFLGNLVLMFVEMILMLASSILLLKKKGVRG